MEGLFFSVIGSALSGKETIIAGELPSFCGVQKAFYDKPWETTQIFATFALIGAVLGATSGGVVSKVKQLISKKMA